MISSSDSDDCIITGYEINSTNKVLMIDDSEPTIKRFKVEQLSIPGNEMIVTVPGDGHCISHCIAKHFEEPLELVLGKLRNEFHSNIAFYSEFSELSPGEILQEVDEYVKKNTYNRTTVDIFLHAFSKIYKTKVAIRQAGNVTLFFGEEYENEIVLSKSRDHFNLVTTKVAQHDIPTVLEQTEQTPILSSNDR